jgi:hypothetical protein
MGARPHTCGVLIIQWFLSSRRWFVLFDLCTPYWSWHSCPEIGSSSIDWAQLSRFYLKTETESSLRNVVFWKINRTVFLDKDKIMDNVQKHNTCTIIWFVDDHIWKWTMNWNCKISLYMQENTCKSHRSKSKRDKVKSIVLTAFQFKEYLIMFCSSGLQIMLSVSNI